MHVTCPTLNLDLFFGCLSMNAMYWYNVRETAPGEHTLLLLVERWSDISLCKLVSDCNLVCWTA